MLIVTTGSKATDLRRGAERLPGRKGKLARSTFLFTPISYQEFIRVCGKSLKEDHLITYLLSGGSPIACLELMQHGVIPEYVIELVRDWVQGEISASGRNRTSMLNIFSTLFRMRSLPLGQSLLAREAINGEAALDPLYYWSNKEHEIDFVVKPNNYLKVKRGKSSPIDFAWAKHQFPNSRLRVICNNAFETDSVSGMTFEQFLSEKDNN